MRGKIIDAEKARLDKVLSHEEIRLLISALGTGIGLNVRRGKLRYHEVVIMTDADVTAPTFARCCWSSSSARCALVSTGHLYIAQPPLFKVKKGESNTLMNSSSSRTSSSSPG